MSKRGNSYKQRFKGIENFLRRVAFNLGNTPSQTEVKIISCIPIDVTDLQQKINCLEKELREVKCTSAYKASVSKHGPTRPATPLVQTVLGKPTPIFSKSKNKLSCKCSQAKVPVAHQACNTKSATNKRGFKRKKSSVCVVSSMASSEKKETYRFTYTHPDGGDVPHTGVPDRISRIGSRIFPKKLQKVLKKRPRRKTHLVYFAQALNTPFKCYDKTSESAKEIELADRSLITRSYITDIVRKQYEQELILEQLSDISQYSSPVCRDDSIRDYHESDISHSYGKYENLDRFLPRRNHSLNIAVNNNLAYYQRERNTYDRYYNSEDYDIYPVREQSAKPKMEDVPVKLMKRLNIECWPETYRAKRNADPMVLQNIEGLHQAYDRRELCTTNRKYTNEHIIANVRRKRCRYDDPKGESCEPKVCSIDYGDIYPKRSLAAGAVRKPKRLAPTHKNAECVTANVNNAECQTVESKAVQLSIPDDNRAELALIQIKTILQTVLAEVKANIKSNNAVSKPKKDVLIQKDVSRKFSYGSTLLNNFTYNPSYNVNPCLARQIPNFCYTNVPMRCFQNYPCTVPTINHQDCQCGHKASGHDAAPSTETRPAAAATVDAEVPPLPARKNEAIGLISEIYKSIALNVDYSNRDLSRISIGCQKRSARPQLGSDTRQPTIAERQPMEEKETQFGTPTVVLACNTDNGTHSCEVTTASELRSETTGSNERSDDRDSAANCDEDKTCDTTTGQLENDTTERTESKDGGNGSGTTSGTSEDTLAAEDASERKEKPGIFQKMLKTVKMFKRMSNRTERGDTKGEESSEDETVTDSQTTRSYITYRDAKRPAAGAAAVPPIKKESPKPAARTVEMSKHFRENARKLSPYMEQEYRRYWDEKLMFHEKQSPKHSSEKSYPGRTRSPRSPVLCRDYQARSVVLRERAKPRERTGLKLEWLRKQKFRAPVAERV